MAEGFKIADGYVDIHGEADRASARRAANEIGDEADEVGRHRGRTFFKALFTPDPGVLMALRTGIPAVLSSPIGIAFVTLGALAASSFIGAFLAGLSIAALGAGFIGLAAFALREVDQVKSGFNDMISEISEGLKLAAMPMADSFRDAFELITNTFNNEVYPLLKEIFEALEPVILPLVNEIGDAIVVFLEAISEPEVLGAIVEFFREVGPKIPEIAESLGQFFTTLAENGPVITDAFTIVIDIMNRLIEISASVLVFFAHMAIIIKRTWDELWQDVEDRIEDFKEVFTTVTNAIKLAWNAVTTFIKARIDDVNRALDGARNAIIRSWAILKEKIIDPIKQGIEGAVMWVRQLPSRAAQALGDIGSRLYEKGKALVQGFINGIKDMAGAVSSAVSVITSFLPFSPVKRGPLMVFNQLSTNPGAKLARMLADGFNTQMQTFTPALAGVGTNNITVNPSINNPPISVRVLLDGREITPAVYATINEHDLQIKRAVTSGGMRLP